jgi:hypothetical protein
MVASSFFLLNLVLWCNFAVSVADVHAVVCVVRTIAASGNFFHLSFPNLKNASTKTSGLLFYSSLSAPMLDQLVFFQRVGM